LSAGEARTYPSRPIVGVGAVVLDGERVLLVRRGREPLKGLWSIPGGAVEVGETREEALSREVREETGLEIEIGPLVAVLDRIRRDEAGKVEYHYVLVDYVCRPVGGALAAATDVDRAEWVAIDDLDRYEMTHGTAAVIRDGRALVTADRRR
jgi:mutator protein MutT